MRWSAIPRLAASLALVTSTTAILVTEGSPCDDQCGNVLSATTGADIECDQDKLGSGAGVVFKNCMNCELNSKYYSTESNQTDQQWMMYNSRFALSYCLWGFPGNFDVGSSPCTTSRACGPLQESIQDGNFSTSVGTYDYCANWAWSRFVGACVSCLQASASAGSKNLDFLANLVVLLQTGCDQRPTPGSTVVVDGGIFSTTLMKELTPTYTTSWTNPLMHGPISAGAAVGIAIGGLCFLLAAAGFCIVCNGRRRRRAFLRKLEMRHNNTGWENPSVTGVAHRAPDMNETPLSQKPLHGWDDTNQSATASELSYSRYFSPSSSQFNSPVSAAETPAIKEQHWPQSVHNAMPQLYSSSSQERAMQDQHEAAAGISESPNYAGLSLGGDKKSPWTESPYQATANEENAGVEEFELHEMNSGRDVNLLGHSTASALHHPEDYGRHFPDKIPPEPLSPES